MKQALILAGAALALVAAPAAAKPDHAKHKGNKGAQVERDYRYGDRNYRGAQYGYQDTRNCPPGLAKKNNGCQAPGQAKKRLAINSRFNPELYDYRRYDYNQLPSYVRDRYIGQNPDYRDDQYYYDQGAIYRVDPTTMVVEQIIRALIR